nr:ATPase [Mycolicibacterium chubuense]
MRSVLALAVASAVATAWSLTGLVFSPGMARAAPGICPPFCDAIPDSAWIESSSIPLSSVYRWPGLAGVAVTAAKPRFEFESWCASPAIPGDPRDYAVAARATVPNPDGQWNLQAQVLHWRGDTVTGGRTALATIERARMALSSCGATAPTVSPSLTTSEADRLAAVISDPGSRVMHVYLLAEPSNSTVVEVVLWTTIPAVVEWRAVSDAQIFDAMSTPLCAAYLGSCR